MATPDLFTQSLREISAVHQQFAVILDMGFLIFVRVLGFLIMAPVFGRKDIPFNIRLGLATMLTFILVWQIPATPEQKQMMSSDNTWTYSLLIFINVSIGMLIGFIAAAIMEVINSAGSIMNNQIGLSSAMMFDPSNRQQVALVEKMLGFLALMIFFQIGGFYWLLNALQKSFTIFPIYSITPDITKEITLDYLVEITGNVLVIGTVLIAPIMVVTISVDLILAIVNRTAQQIQVFQLSFGLKPSIGMATFLITLPIFIKLVENYLRDYASIF